MGYWEVAFILSTSLNVVCEEFLPVHTSCRYWDRLDIYSDGDTEVFHCIIDQDKVPGIVYTEWIMIPSGMCPIYNRYAKEIDGIPCNSSIGNCPTKPVKSHQAVVYTGCFQMPDMVNTENCQPAPESNVESQTNTEKCMTVQEYVKNNMEISISLMVVQILAIPVLCTALGICTNRWTTKKNKSHTPKEYAEQGYKRKAADSDLEPGECSPLNSGDNINECNGVRNLSKPSGNHFHDVDD